MLLKYLFPFLALATTTTTGCLLNGETNACKAQCDEDLPGPNNQEDRIQCRADCHEKLCSQQSWSQIGRDIHGRQEFDEFGHSIDLSDNGRTLAVSAAQGGYVRVYDLEEMGDGTDDKWNKRGEDIELPAVIAYENTGWGGAVSLSSNGMIVAVGDMFSDTGGAGGAVFVYAWNENEKKWKEMGNTIKGGSSDGDFGRSVSLLQNEKDVTVAVGAWFANEVRVFQYMDDEDQWQLKGNVIKGISGSLFGASVSLGGDGDIVAVAAPYDDQSQVSVWFLIDNEWSKNIYDTKPDAFVESVSLSQGAGWKVGFGSNVWDWQGEPLRVGGDDGNPGLGWVDGVSEYRIDLSANGRVFAGRGDSVRVFALSIEGNPPDPTQMGPNFEGIYGCFDEADRSLALSADGTVFAVGSTRCHDDGDGAGLVRVFRFDDTWPNES